MTTPFKDIKFFDTTLRDGEQTPGVSLTADEKLWIARQLDALGVHVIEAGSAVTSEGERAAIRAVASEGLNAEICSFTRVLKSDIDLALECNVDSVHLVVPVSDLHIQQKLKKDRETVLQMAVDVTEYAKEHGLIVELSGEDASRADLDYLMSLYKEGISSGADRLCFCDTVGVLIPERTEMIFKKLAELGVPVSVHCHDDFGLATANSIAALKAGAGQVHVTVNGLGERAGNASLEEVVMTLDALYGYKTKINTTNLYKTSRLVSRLTGVPIAPNKAIVGDNAFTHESGIHAHGILADTSTYEPITPEIVGRTRKIVLGKHAGKSSVQIALKEIGLEASGGQVSEITKRIKELGDKGKRVTDADLQAIAEAVLGYCREARVKLEELIVVSGNKVTPTASVKLIVDNRDIVESGTGLGPVDAAINALRKAIADIADIELEEYRVEAITGGTDALVEVWVKLSKDGKMVTARGARADIIMASVEAVVEGINRLLE
ncbi:MAG: 2-isopropylmalate synthase [Methanosarcinales archaeon Met12]|nr:MAG: 2-isopropylmalate synthase [Methanosarcinales archaeon Met12]